MSAIGVLAPRLIEEVGECDRREFYQSLNLSRLYLPLFFLGDAFLPDFV